MSHMNVITYPYDDVLILLHSWSFRHPLLPNSTLITEIDRPKAMDEIDTADEFKEYVENFKKQNYRGDISYCVGYNVDHQDNRYGRNFELIVTDGDYSEALATGKYLAEHPELRTKIRGVVNEDPQAYFKMALPSDIFLNLVVISECGNILALRRSKSVASARGVWCIGAYETMEQYHRNTAQGDTDFHSLAARCLREEMNISQVEKDENNKVIQRYESVFISSISLSLSHAGLLVTGVVRLKNITEGEVTDRITRSAHSKYEHDGVKWLPMNSKEIKKFVEEGTGMYDDFVKSSNERWIAYTRWSLYECLRVHDYDDVLR